MTQPPLADLTPEAGRPANGGAGQGEEVGAEGCDSATGGGRQPRGQLLKLGSKDCCWVLRRRSKSFPIHHISTGQTVCPMAKSFRNHCRVKFLFSVWDLPQINV